MAARVRNSRKYAKDRIAVESIRTLLFKEGFFE